MVSSNDTVLSLFTAAAASAPSSPLFRQVGGAVLTYGDAARRVVWTARNLTAIGLRRGDRAVSFTEDSISTAIVALACSVIGVQPAPLSPIFSLDYLSKVCDCLGTVSVFSQTAWSEQLIDAGLRPLGLLLDQAPLALPTPEDAAATLERACAELSPTDPFMVQPTSGSTGVAKLVVRHHQSFVRYARYVGRELAAGEERHRFLGVAALTHAFGLHMFTTALSTASTIELTTSIDSGASLVEVRRLDPTVLPMTPRVLRSLYRQHLGDAPGDRLFGPSARFLLTAGGRSDAELVQLVKGEGLDVLEFYGSTELSLVALTPRGSWRSGYVGRVVDDAEVKVVDGELTVRSPGLMIGFVEEPSERHTQQVVDGFLASGDLGVVEPEGWLRILGRERDVFNSPEGSNIFPERVETMVEALPWVSQAMLIGDGRPFLIAFVVPSPGELPAAGLVETADGVLDVQAHDEIYRRAGRELELLNASLERIERVAGLVLVSRPFDEDLYARVGAGKIRRDRQAFAARFAKPIEQRYAASSAAPNDAAMVPVRDRRLQPWPLDDLGAHREGLRVGARLGLELEIDGVRRSGRATDLSAAGVLIELVDPPPVGARITVWLRSGPGLASATARVARSSDDAIGVELVEPSPEFSALARQLMDGELEVGRPPSERRDSLRVTLNLDLVVVAGDRRHPARARSLSASGAYVYCDPGILHGPVRVELGDDLVVEGTVIRRGHDGVAVAFEPLSPAQADAIASLMRQVGRG